MELTWEELRSAWCIRHQRYFSISDESASIHVAGTPCVAFSSIGELMGELSLSFVHFLIWLGLRKLVREPVVIQECVSGFPREWFPRICPEYEWTFGIITPQHFGWPIMRDRQWVVCRGHRFCRSYSCALFNLDAGLKAYRLYDRV